MRPRQNLPCHVYSAFLGQHLFVSVSSEIHSHENGEGDTLFTVSRMLELYGGLRGTPPFPLV
jgi:hypothetical protein